MSAEPLPEWVRPPLDGFTADHLDLLPNLPPHTELIDGSLVFVSPQTKFHTLVMRMIENGLARSAPSSLRVRREMTITLDDRQRPEPDVLVVHAATDQGMERTTYHPDDVVLAVEVVSPDSERRDRERKPQLYARAGIHHFWRIENAEERAVVHVYEIDEASTTYVPTGIYHDRMRITVPFPIDIDLTEIERL